MVRSKKSDGKWAYNAAAWLYQWRRDIPAVHDAVEQGLALASEYGFAQLQAAGTLAQGWALVEQGQAEAGISRLQQGLRDIRATGTQIGYPWYLALLAQAYRNTGQAAKGRPLIDEALAYIEQTGERLVQAECYHLKGQLVVGAEDEEEAEKCFQKAIAIAQHQSAKAFELRAATSLARLWQRRGKKPEAHQLLSEIYGWFTEGFDTKDLQDAKALLEELA